MKTREREREEKRKFIEAIINFIIVGCLDFPVTSQTHTHIGECTLYSVHWSNEEEYYWVYYCTSLTLVVSNSILFPIYLHLTIYIRVCPQLRRVKLRIFYSFHLYFTPSCFTLTLYFCDFLSNFKRTELRMRNAEYLVSQ